MNKPATPRPSTAPATEARQARLLAIVVGGVFLALVIGFVSMVFFVRDETRLNAVGPIAAAPGAEQGGMVFHGTVNVWEVRGRMTVDAEREARFALDLRGPTSQPAPPTLQFDLSLDQPGTERPPIPLRHASAGPGSWVASAPLPEPGRWRLRLALPEISGVFEFEVER